MQMYREEQLPSLRHTNEIVGAFIACGGRMYLNAYLGKLWKRDLYYDTHSPPIGQLPLLQ